MHTSQTQFKPYRPRSVTGSVESSDNVNFLAFCLSAVIGLFLDVLFKLSPSWILGWVKWCPTSSQALEVVEKELLSNLRRPYKVSYVNIGPCWEKEDNLIWTLRMNPVLRTDKTPLVFLHGFASGIGLWVLNLDSLSTTRPVFAFDILGFGRSSRPTYSSDAAEAEQQFVTSIEMWRKAVGLESMILLGHNMGGFLATSYALCHPEHVDHLILIDPWGFPERPIRISRRYELPHWVNFISTFISNFNFLAILRASGPIGPYLVDIFRRDLQRKYSKILKNKNAITRYIYHCNVQHPSGEVGFKAMADSAGWPIHPMINRIGHLVPHLPIVFIYGSRSWVHRQPALQIKYSRLNSFVGIEVIDCAGHHVYADQPDEFNTLIHGICEEPQN